MLMLSLGPLSVQVLAFESVRSSPPLAPLAFDSFKRSGTTAYYSFVELYGPGVLYKLARSKKGTLTQGLAARAGLAT